MEMLYVVRALAVLCKLLSYKMLQHCMVTLQLSATYTKVREAVKIVKSSLLHLLL